MKRKFIKLIEFLALFIFINLLILNPLMADDARLMDSYPPNFEAENFVLRDMNGNKHELKDFRGKFIVVNFWSMSCNVCKSEMTTLQSAMELLDSDKLEIISIHAGNNFDGVEEVLKLNKIFYTVLFDTELQLGGWGIPILPTSFIVGPKGNIRYRAVGTRVWNSPFMIDFIQSIIKGDDKNSTMTES